MERLGIARRTFGILVRATLAAALVATIVLGSGMGNVARRSSMSVAVDDGSYGGTTTAWVLSTGGNLAQATGSGELWVWAECFQNDHLVYWENPRVGSSMTATLTLGPTAWWTGGAAACTADLKWWDVKRSRFVVLSTTTFDVAG